MERRTVLETVVKPLAGIQLGKYVEAQGKALFELTRGKGIEGIVARRKDRFTGLGNGAWTGKN